MSSFCLSPLKPFSELQFEIKHSYEYLAIILNIYHNVESPNKLLNVGLGYHNYSKHGCLSPLFSKEIYQDRTHVYYSKVSRTKITSLCLSTKTMSLFLANSCMALENMLFLLWSIFLNASLTLVTCERVFFPCMVIFFSPFSISCFWLYSASSQEYNQSCKKAVNNFMASSIKTFGCQKGKACHTVPI